MSVTVLLSNLAGFVALLLWGTHMVTTGMLRGFGGSLRQHLGSAVARPSRAFLAGLGATVALQSSTATGLMAASFTAEGLMGLSAGYVMMLGANVGTALVTRVLSFPIGPLAPVGILVGLVLFRKSRTDRYRNVGRMAMGLGLMLLALHSLVDLLTPWTHHAGAAAVEQWLASQPMVAFAVAIVAAWACHSSMAIVLLVAAVSTAAGLPPEVAVACMLGANVGGALPPVFESGSIAARRLPIGNLLVRALGCVAVLATMGWWVPHLPAAWVQSGAFVADSHLAFNALLALVALPWAQGATALLLRAFPDPPRPDDPGQPQYLDANALGQIHVALTAAEREALRMADQAEGMLRAVLPLLTSGDPQQAKALAQHERDLSRLGWHIRKYVADVAQAVAEPLSQGDARRVEEVVQFVIDLENLAELVGRQLAPSAVHQHKARVAFSAEEQQRLKEVHAEVLEGFQLALAVFMAHDIRAARALLANKEALRVLEQQTVSQTRALSALAQPGDAFLRTFRDLKRVHSELAGLAYQVLDDAGELRSRLHDTAAEPDVALEG